MVDSKNRKSSAGERIDDVDPKDQMIDAEDSTGDSSSADTDAVSANRAVTRRLTEMLAEDGDGDLLLQLSDREDSVLQWLRALDMQVMGACRADERLKPLLKLNTSTDVAEDPLLAHLSQHFEPAEVGMLARCLCIPLVSIRVGKINKQGTLLFPSSIRGNLCLSLLPTSDLRVSFNGDDGSIERLATLSTEVQCNDVEIEDITADKSERAFLMKFSDSVVFYFWCSEKSKLLGAELQRKMKDLLIKKPSLAELTGISDSRLRCFAAHFRAYLAGSVLTSTQTTAILPTSLSDNSIDCSESPFPQSSSSCQTSANFQQYSSQENCVNRGSPSCPLSSLKEGLHKDLSISSARDKFISLNENCIASSNISVTTSGNGPDPSDWSFYHKDKLPEPSGTNPLAILNFLDILDKSMELPNAGPEKQNSSSGSSPFSPHYCWCPPVASAMQSSIGNPQLQVPSTESSPLPPLSSLISSGRSSILLTSKPLLNLADLPPIDFPDLPPEPLVRLPATLQIPAYAPLMCDPIVHLPVIDICSSGQAYLVSGGPAMSTVIPPLNLTVVDPLLPKTAESMVEKSARETLRMLISSSKQVNQPLQVLPSVVLSNDKENIILGGSRGVYVGAQDIDAISSGMSTMELILSSADGVVVGKRCVIPRENLMDQMENPWNNDNPAEFDE